MTFSIKKHTVRRQPHPNSSKKNNLLKGILGFDILSYYFFGMSFFFTHCYEIFQTQASILVVKTIRYYFLERCIMYVYEYVPIFFTNFIFPLRTFLNNSHMKKATYELASFFFNKSISEFMAPTCWEITFFKDRMTKHSNELWKTHDFFY